MSTGLLIPVAVPDFPTNNQEGLWPERQVSVLAGTSGAGKTTMLYQLLAGWSAGETPFGFAGTPGPYGLIAADRTIEAHQRTAKLVGLPWDQLVVRSLVDDPSVKATELEANPFRLLFDLLDSVRHKLPANKPARIIVDPLMVFLGIDLNKYHLVAARLLVVNRWCLATNSLIVATHHATKARSDWSFKRPQDRIAGSGAMLAFTSTQGFLAAPEEGDPDNPYAHLVIVSHHHAPLTIQLTRNEIGLFQAVNGAGTKKGQHADPLHAALVADTPPGKAALHVLACMLPGVPVTRKHLVELAGPSSATVDRALAELVGKQMIDVVSHGVYVRKAAQ